MESWLFLVRAPAKVKKMDHNHGQELLQLHVIKLMAEGISVHEGKAPCVRLGRLW